MKKILLLFSAICFCFIVQAQERVVKVSGLDAAFGKYEVSFERTFNEGMNNIKSSGRNRKQGSWPNILTKGSIQFSVAIISKTHTQDFGSGLTAVVDTNTNHHPFFDPAVDIYSDFRVVDNPSIHSVTRSAVTKVSGFAAEIEYRSYFKTYDQKIGDAPRGWYIAPFAGFQSTTLDFDDNTEQSVNQAMNYLMYPTNAYHYSQQFPNANGPWEGGESSVSTAANYGYAATPTNNNITSTTFNAYDLSWHDVSYTQTQSVISAGIAIGRQWLIKDKISIDVQLGPKYQIVTQGERVFNGNDTWNLNNQFGVSQYIDDMGYTGADAYDENWFLFAKYGDVYSFDGSGITEELANGYYGAEDENEDVIVIKSKSEGELGNTTGFYRSLPGLTDFGKLETYRIKLKVGFAF